MTRHRAWGVVAFVLLCAAAGHMHRVRLRNREDSSGAVLPGVTVEAARAVLIEKTRSVITDRGVSPD